MLMQRKTVLRSVGGRQISMGIVSAAEGGTLHCYYYHAILACLRTVHRFRGNFYATFKSCLCFLSQFQNCEFPPCRSPLFILSNESTYSRATHFTHVSCTLNMPNRSVTAAAAAAAHMASTATASLCLVRSLTLVSNLCVSRPFGYLRFRRIYALALKKRSLLIAIIDSRRK